MALEQIGLAAVLQDANFQAGLKRYTSGLGQMTKSTDSAAGILTKLGGVMQGALVVGVGAATAAFAGAIAIAKTGLDATLGWAEQLDKLGDQFGMSGEVASGWAFLMNRVGLSVDEGAQGLNYFTNQLGSFGKTMKDGTLQVTPFSDALKKLGINAIDPTTKKVKTFDQLMPEIMDKFEKLPAGIDASALAMDLFGTRGGTKFLDFLRQGGKGLDDAKKKAKEFGLELSTDEVNAAEEFGFAMNELNLEFTGFKNTIGRYVLPIAKELVRWISVNAIPKFIELAKRWMPMLISGFQRLGDWIGRIANVFGDLQFGFSEARGDFSDFYSSLSDLLGSDAAGFFTGIAEAIKRIADAFSKGGITGAVGQLATEIKNAWPTISAQLATWKDQFWNWLTGPDGAIFQAATKVGEVAKKIADWLTNNWDGLIKPTLMGWVGLFWEWLAGRGGVLDSLATRMDELFPALNTWLKDPQTAKDLEEIGAGIARTILDGIGNLFSEDQNRSDSAMNHLITSLNQARLNLAGGIAGLAANVAIDIGNALSAWLGGPIAVGQLRDALYVWIANAINALVLGNPAPFIQQITDWLLGTGQTQTPTTPPGMHRPTLPGNTPAGPAFQHGGYVPTNMLARLHAGEYVIPASRVSNITHNTRTIGEGAIVINFPSTGGLSQKSIRDTVYVAVREVLDSA